MGLAISVNLDNPLGCCSFLCHNSSGLLGRLLLVGNGFLLALAGAGVVLGALATYGKTDTVADSAVASDVHQTLDVHLDGRTEFTFDLVLADGLADRGCLGIVPVTDLDTIIDSALLEDLPRRAATDSEDIGQTYLSPFVVR